MPIIFSDSVAKAIARRHAVVALESTVIAHGLPHPLNLETSLECESIIETQGALPATVGIVDGVPTIGLDPSQIETFASGVAPDGSRIEKVSLSNLAVTVSRKGWGATTVASTIRIASLGGRPAADGGRPLVFSTGGIGGVHRGVESSFDVSSDLTALATTQIVVVSAGAKAILDLPKTLEFLETSGVPVIGFQTDEFPAFYSRRSGLPVDASVNSVEEAADIAMNHWLTGDCGAVLVCVPVPEQAELAASEVAGWIDAANLEARDQGIRGKAVTPFVLGRIVELSEGSSLGANTALLKNNALVAAGIAKVLTKLLV